MLMFCAGVCGLPMCGHGQGNRAPCAGRSICASFAPLGVYIYALGGESCTTRHPLLRSARQDPDRDRAWHPRVLGPVGGPRHSLRGKARLLPRAASTIRVTMLRRRDTASSPRSRLVSHHANRRRAVPLRSLLPSVDLGPTFRCGAFFFVASALADVPPARLTLPASNLPRVDC